MKDSVVVIKTTRLLLKKFCLDDAPSLLTLNADPEVMQYTGDLPFRDLNDAVQFVENYTHYQEFGYGRWSVYLKQNSAFIGWCGLKFNQLEKTDIGFRFMKKYWGQGYATEAALACLQYGFDHLGLKEIIGRADIRNIASIKVLEKIGMAYWKEDTCRGLMDAKYYRIIH